MNIGNGFGSAVVRKTIIKWGLIISIGWSFAACATHSTVPCNPKRCVEIVPKQVKGLQVLSGTRHAQSIINDMVPVVCNGHALFKRMQAADPTLKPGKLIYRVVVEYTGEVNRVTVEETNLASRRFIDYLSDYMMDSDFAGWAIDETDSVFLYPMAFGADTCKEQ